MTHRIQELGLPQSMHGPKRPPNDERCTALLALVDLFNSNTEQLRRFASGEIAEDIEAEEQTMDAQRAILRTIAATRPSSTRELAIAADFFRVQVPQASPSDADPEVTFYASRYLDGVAREVLRGTFS